MMDAGACECVRCFLAAAWPAMGAAIVQARLALQPQRAHLLQPLAAKWGGLTKRHCACADCTSLARMLVGREPRVEWAEATLRPGSKVRVLCVQRGLVVSARLGQADNVAAQVAHTHTHTHSGSHIHVYTHSHIRWWTGRCASPSPGRALAPRPRCTPPCSTPAGCL